MSNFFERVNTTYTQGGISQILKELGSFGVKGRNDILKNSQSIGYNQNKSINDFGFNELEEYDYLNVITNNNSKYVPFQDRAYKDRRAEFRNVSTEGEIENILTIITDESIVYDDSNYFAEPTALPGDLKNKEALQKSLEVNFKKIYNLFNFNNVTTAWWLFYKFLVDGFLAFEIIYDNPAMPKNIIGFKEIDPLTMEQLPDVNGVPVWVQYRGDMKNQRILSDSQVIYISYASSLIDGKVSYIERLIKPYNILSIMEQTRSTWAVVNSSFRMKFVIPVGGKSKNVAKQTLKGLMNRYNEEITFDNTNGQYHINGKPHLPGVKQIWLPEKDGSTPTIEAVGGDGPDLSDTDALSYFRSKLERISKIPTSRFSRDGDGGGDTMDNSNSQITQEEARFNRFIIRLRSVFKEILTKPLWIQMVLEHRNFRTDPNFKNAINVNFFKYNLFEEFKEMEVQNKKMEHIERMSELMDGDDPFFSMKFLIKKFAILSEEDLRENEKIKKKEKKEKEAKELEEMNKGIDNLGDANAEDGLDLGTDNKDNTGNNNSDEGSPLGDDLSL